MKEKVSFSFVEGLHAAFDALSRFLNKKIQEIITLQHVPDGTQALANAMIHAFTHQNK